MQKVGLPMRFPLWIVAALVAASPALAIESSATDWAVGSKSKARLIASGPADAAFEIVLSEGAITYWRDPGEAGVPPSFDFSGSENLARAEIAFPAPTRIRESDGTDAFGYSGSVTLPIRVTAVDAARPVRLAMKASFGVCEKICLPAKANLTLNLPASASPFAAAIAAARAAVPKQASPDALGVKVSAIDAKAWRICLGGRDAARDLFLEAPAGYWLTTKSAAANAGQDCFEAHLDEAPGGARMPLDVVATISGASPAETTLSLLPAP